MDKQNSVASSSPAKNRIPLIISLLIVVILIISYFLIPQMKEALDETWNVLTSNDRDKIEVWVDQFGWWGPAIIILVMIVQTFLLFLPTIAFIVVIILAYGPFWGSILALISITIASMVGYGVGRLLGKLFVIKMLGQKTENKVAAFIKDYGFWAVFLVRFNSLLSNDAASFVAGMLGMNFMVFTLATLSGITPLILMIAWFGESFDNLKNGLIWISVISLLLFGLYIWWDKKRSSITNNKR